MVYQNQENRNAGSKTDRTGNSIQEHNTVYLVTVFLNVTVWFVMISNLAYNLVDARNRMNVVASPCI